MDKRAVIIVRLVPTPEAYEGKTNRDVEKEILAEKPQILYGAEVERIVVFNSPSGAKESGAFKQSVMDAFISVHEALGPMLKHLSNKGITAQAIFKAEHGYHIIVCEKAEREG
jgi:hypothetical protein